MRLLHILISCLALAFTTSPNMAIAAKKSPWELPEPKGKEPGKGMVIIALDDRLISDLKLDPPQDDFGLAVTWFDPELKRPHIELHWISSPNAAEFRTVTDESGRRYLVGAIGQGEALVVSYTIQSKWSTCYNSETVHFFIKEGTYNFIGLYDPWLARARIERAVITGQMPSSVPQNSAIPPLRDVKLEGFTPAKDLPDIKANIETIAGKALGKPIEILTPELKTTDYTLSRNAYGQPSCMFWRSKSKRPDRTSEAKKVEANPTDTKSQ